MNKKHNTYIHFWLFIILMLASAVGMGVVYQTARNRPPIIYDRLTPEIIDSLNSQKARLSHLGAIFTDNPFSLNDWDNINDLGSNNSDNWEKVEDANFVVYYKADVENTWKSNAELTLKLANKTIPALKKTFGRYYYPADVKDRKLPIYLPPTPSQFSQTVRALGYSNTNSDCIGITLYMVSPSGIICSGIVIKSTSYQPETETENSVFSVLPHEMSHYVYANAYDYNQQSTPLNWISEGVADYVAGRRTKIAGSDSILFINNKCHLEKDFPSREPRFADAEYWAGESFFKFVKEKYGQQQVENFIKRTYDNDIKTALTVTFGGRDIHDEWVKSLQASSSFGRSESMAEDDETEF